MLRLYVEICAPRVCLDIFSGLEKRKIPPPYSRALPIHANIGRERGPTARVRFTVVGMTDG